MIGRFLTEDPFSIKTRQRAPKTLRDDFESMERIRSWLTNSQKLNNYLYTINNPSSFNDPTGLDNPQNDPRYLKCIEELELLKLSCSMKKAYDPKCWIDFKLKSEECALIALNIIRTRREEFKGPTPECPQDTYQLPGGI